MSTAIDVSSHPYADRSEGLGFTAEVAGLTSFDHRGDAELRAAAHDHESPLERERAAWEYAHRAREDSLPFLEGLLGSEREHAIRSNLLWLGLKTGGRAALALVERALVDEHREVRDWAKCYLSELTGAELEPEYRAAGFTNAGPFDQTLPLQIAGYALVEVPDGGRLRATLSPLWFERIMGRVMACTRQETFMHDLTIEKCLEGYHPDGSDHYEIFQFSGVSWPSGGDRIQHRYESHTLRSFYPSGRVEDHSQPVDRDVPVILNRAAETSSAALAAKLWDFSLPSGPPREFDPKGERLTDARGVKLLNGRVVRTVGGQFFGWAHSSLDHFARSGEILPGTVQLANPMFAATAEWVNTYLCGTFRGKLSDHDGDGMLDVNLIPCHGTPEGKLDYHADGSLAPDPFA